MINLNIGSFRTYTKLVASQSLDSTNDVIRLSYRVSVFKTKHHYYLENKIEYLNMKMNGSNDNTKNKIVCLVKRRSKFQVQQNGRQQSYCECNRG